MAQKTRRDFLEQSMLTAAAAAVAGAPTFVPAEDAQSTSPNERLQVACIGVRGRGQSHLSAFSRRKDTEVVAVVDPDEAIGQQRAEKVANSSGRKPEYFADMRKVFEDKSIDIVSIATPNHWHALAAIWAIQAGKDVYVEKPVSHNVSEGRRIVQAARKYGKIVQTGTQCRSMGGTIQAIDHVHQGKIGDVSVARGLCYKRRGSIGARGKYDVPSSIDYNLWLGPAPERTLSRPRFHYDWHWQWDYGNGDLGNQGIHQMDIARWGLGVDSIGNSVYSYGGRLGYVDAGDTANTQVSIHDYGDKRLVFEVRGLPTDRHKGAGVGVIFEGSEGYVVLGSYNGGAAFDPDGKMVKKFSAGGDHFANFLSAVRSRKHTDLNADILDGHLSSALCHLGNVSYRLGNAISVADIQKRFDGDDEATATLDRVVSHLGKNKVDLASQQLTSGLDLRIDPKKEVFISSAAAEANPYLSRDYRKPFVVPSANDV